MYFLAWLQLIVVGFVALYEWRKVSLGIFLWGPLFILFSVPHLGGIYSKNLEFSTETYVIASAFVIFFSIIYLLTKLYFDYKQKHKNTKPNIFEINYTSNDIDKFNYSSYLIPFILFVVLFCIFFLVQDHLKFTWTGIRRLSLEYGLLNPLRYTDYIYFAFSGVLLYSLKNKQRKGVILFGLLTIYSLLKMNRITLIPLLVAPLIYFVWNDKLSSVKIIILTVLFGVVSIYIIYYLRLARMNDGISNLLFRTNFFDNISQINEQLFNGDGELGLRKIFYYFIENNNQFPGFQQGRTYTRLLMLPIPSKFSLGLKPGDFAITMAQAWTGDFTNKLYSVHPTLFGDAYANFGFLGVFLGAFWSLFVKFIERIVRRFNGFLKTNLVVLFATTLVIISRGSIYNPIAMALYSSILLLIINFVFNILSNRKKSFMIVESKDRFGVVITRNAEYGVHSSFNRTINAFSDVGISPNEIYIVDRVRSGKELNTLNRESNIKVESVFVVQGKGFKKITSQFRYYVELYKTISKLSGRVDTIYSYDLDTGLVVKLISIFHPHISYYYHVADFYSDSRLANSNKLVQRFFKTIEKIVMYGALESVICVDYRMGQVGSYREDNLSVIHNSPVIKNEKTIRDEVTFGCSEVIKMGYVGTLRDNRFLLEAINAVSKKPNYELHIAGLGKMSEEISKISDNNKGIYFYGSMPYEDTFDFYGKVDIILSIYDPNIPNHKYSAPNKFYEALLLGKAIIVAEGTGVDQFVRQYNTGYVIDYNSSAFEKLLNKIITDDGRLELSEIKRSSFNTYSQFSWESQKEKLVSIINKEKRNANN